jgi:tetratricopeptide (TPR) repeat protein
MVADSRRVLFPSGFTKADAVAYYEAISAVLLPHLRNRPVSFKRYVDTTAGDSFWEKDAPSFTPKWVKRFPVPRREGAPIEYIIINDVLAEAGASAEAYCLLGIIASAAGALDEAIRHFNKALYLKQDHHEALVHLALLHEQRGEHTAAANFRRRAERARGGELE